MRIVWLLCGVALTISSGLDAQTRSRDEARKQQEQLRQERERAREEERTRRDAFVAQLVKAERERGLAETVGADRISFAAGESALSKDAELVLIRTVHWLRLHPESALQLQERCAEPLANAHLELGKRRTQRVNDFLVDYSASAQRVQRLAPVVTSSGEIRTAEACAVFLTVVPGH